MPNVKIDVSVVITSYYTGPILARCLDSVMDQEGLREVIFVDNGNHDDARERLDNFAKTQAKLKIRRGHGNIGFAAACNLGVAQAKGEYVLLLNPDCILPTGALVQTVKALKKHPEAWMAGCKLIAPNGSPHTGNRRRLLTPSIAIAHALNLHKIWHNKCISLPEMTSEETEYTPAISGAFMCLARKRYKALKGLDEGYFFHVEDLDLCKNISDNGGKILYLSDLEVMHFKSSSMVTHFFIESHKSNGFTRYFRKHYKESLPFGGLILMNSAVYAKLVLKFPIYLLRNIKQKRNIKHQIKCEKLQLHCLNNVTHNEKLNKNGKPSNAPILVIGASGQIGLNIVRQLLKENTTVYAHYNRHAIDYRHPNLTWIQGDITSQNLPFMAKNYFKKAPKTLIHTAGLWHLANKVDDYTNLGIRQIIAFSSTSIEGKKDSNNAYEIQLIKKLKESEAIVKKHSKNHNIKWTIFRPTMIYGNGLDQSIMAISNFIEKFNFFPLMKPGNGNRQPVHSDDLASATVEAIRNDALHNQTYNLSGADCLGYDKMVEKIFQTLGKKPRLVKTQFLPIIMTLWGKISRNEGTNGEVAKRMNENLAFNHNKATKEFGYNPKGFLSNGIDDLGRKS